MIDIQQIYLYEKEFANIVSFIPAKKKIVLISKLSEIDKLNLPDSGRIEQKVPFCIEYDKKPSTQLTAQFIRKTFYPNYIKKNITVFVSNKSDKRIISHELSLHGYQNVEIFSPEDYISFRFGSVHGNLVKTLNTNGYHLIVSQNIDTKPEIIAKVLNDLVHELNDKNTKLQLSELGHELEITKSELENYKTYLSIAVNEKETSKILEFYHTQYETLPLWYKRIGHLIKLLTGKRKF